MLLINTHSLEVERLDLAEEICASRMNTQICSFCAGATQDAHKPQLWGSSLIFVDNREPAAEEQAAIRLWPQAPIGALRVPDHKVSAAVMAALLSPAGCRGHEGADSRKRIDLWNKQQAGSGCMPLPALCGCAASSSPAMAAQ